MNKCLICDNYIDNGASIIDIFKFDDCICFYCRNKFVRNKKTFKIDNIKCYSTYIYEENFSSVLIQYKECFDEALNKVFLDVKSFKRKFKGYTIIPIPSGKSKLEERGFNHIIKIFELTNMDILDCLYKKEDIKQMYLSYEERLKMIDNISLKENIKIPSKVVLVDDVCTSKTTLKSALKVLKNKCKTIKIYTISTHIENIK